MGNRNACALCARCYDVEFCEECYDGDMFEPFVAACKQCLNTPVVSIGRSGFCRIMHICGEPNGITDEIQGDNLGSALRLWNDAQEAEDAD